ncbi:hypothetical protein EVAR_11815_1 [Eumeta japonica]|uniref:Uncharacterized protein n=1 Tax=Eumeta variegata TaxID=151549 RepID=A0A4C1UQU6_EUMVA|nr:hypothetical protein EVAR_11815_1 [Eumeta japonica]
MLLYYSSDQQRGTGIRIESRSGIGIRIEKRPRDMKEMELILFTRPEAHVNASVNISDIFKLGRPRRTTVDLEARAPRRECARVGARRRNVGSLRELGNEASSGKMAERDEWKLIKGAIMNCNSIIVNCRIGPGRAPPGGLYGAQLNVIMSDISVKTLAAHIFSNKAKSPFSSSLIIYKYDYPDGHVDRTSRPGAAAAAAATSAKSRAGLIKRHPGRCDATKVPDDNPK